jgi:hypothetical protein
MAGWAPSTAPIDATAGEIRARKVGIDESGGPEVRVAEVRPGEVRPAEVRPAEKRPAEVRPGEVRPAEVRVFLVHPAEICVAEGGELLRETAEREGRGRGPQSMVPPFMRLAN